MRSRIESLFLIVLLGVGVYLAYTHPTELRGIVRMVQTAVAPCAQPITYSLGSVDKRFGISDEKLLTHLASAEKVWESAAGKELFTYREEGGEVTVNLVYDSRQEATDNLKVAGIAVEKTRASYEALKSRYATLASRVDAQKTAYERALSRYEEQQTAYNAAVGVVNSRGGATPSEAAQLRAQKSSLEQEFAALQDQERSVRSDISTVNALATTLNQLIVQLNIKVDQYNDAGAGAGEFEEGLYERVGGVQKIDIYEFSDETQLVRVLAHEMGHALGLEHVGDEGAIMYQVNAERNLSVVPADIAELARVCRIDTKEPPKN